MVSHQVQCVLIFTIFDSILFFKKNKAALQFEWAWQNPHKSRHLRDHGDRIFGNRGTGRVDKNIR